MTGARLPGRLDRRVEHALGGQRISEIGKRNNRDTATDDGQDVAGLIDEGVLVAEPVAVGPPRVDVRVAIAAAGDVDRRPPLHCSVVAQVVELQLVESFEVEPQRSSITMDLEAVCVVIAGGEASGFEAGDSPAAQPAEEQHGIVDGARRLGARRARAGAGDLATRLAFENGALLDERVLDRPLDGDDLLTRDESDGVDDVGVEIAVGAGAGDVALESPQQRCVRASPALQVGRHARGRSGRSCRRRPDGAPRRRPAPVGS